MHKIKYIPGTGFKLYDKQGTEIDLPLKNVIVNDNWEQNQKERLLYYREWAKIYKAKGVSEDKSWEKAYKHTYPDTVRVTFELECIFEP